MADMLYLPGGEPVAVFGDREDCLAGLIRDHMGNDAELLFRSVCNLNRVIEDYRRRFKSYRPGTAEQYAADIGQVLHNVLIAWTQHRQCYVDINKEEQTQ